MKTAAIIAEYNPFHNGHKRHIELTREAGFSHVIVLMSGNAVQRGDIAVCDMGFRAETAVRNGADLVLELPMPYSLSSAEDFARSSVDIISRLGCVNALSFGSECGDISKLCRCAEVMENLDYRDIKRLMSNGLTYPAAVSKLLGDGEILNGANNTLAIEYIKAIRKLGADIEPFTVKRNAPHDVDLSSDGCISAMKIREIMREHGAYSARGYLPQVPHGGDLSFIRNDERLILSLAAFADTIDSETDSEAALRSKIKGLAPKARSLDDLYTLAKTKNITHAKIRRAILCMALGITSADLRIAPPYARILAFGEDGRELLGKINESSAIPVSTSLAKLSSVSKEAFRCAELTERASILRDFCKNDVGEHKSEFERMTVISTEG